MSSMKVVIMLCALPTIASGARALRQGEKHRQLTLLQRGIFDDEKPYCIYGSRAAHGGHVEVFVRANNERTLQFGGDDYVGTQTTVKCKGELPKGCAAARKRAKTMKTQSCDSLRESCPCEAETGKLESTYMAEMMNEVVPECKKAGEDPKQQKHGTSFRILLIGLGGGALPLYALAHCPETTSFESIEYDPRVIDASASFFGMSLAQGNNSARYSVENNDGGKAIMDRARRGEKYDIVMVDAFGPGGLVPPSCRDQAFITGTKSILSPKGKVIQQIWSPEHKKVVEDYRKVYGEDKVQRVDLSLGDQHLIIAQNQ